jgi:hypothetical protein
MHLEKIINKLATPSAISVNRGSRKKWAAVDGATANA